MERPVPDQADLPLPDYDHLPDGAIESRVRSLEAAGVEDVLAYERAHADRPHVVQVLENRLEALAGGAEPTGGTPGDEVPEAGEGLPGDSAVGPETEGPPINPPSQGVPTNPAQPRR